MPTPFIMPKFDMDQETATVVEWLKQDGEFVRVDETVLVVETDKVAIDVPAPASGILSGISAEPGEVVPVTTVIAYILAEGETVADLPVEITTGQAGLDGKKALADDESRKSSLAAATPVAKRMARELGIDLTGISTDNARITKADVTRHVASLGSSAGSEIDIVQGRVTMPATPAARRLAKQLAIDLEAVAGSGPRGRIQEADVQAAATKQIAEITPRLKTVERLAERIPLVGMRRTIAERMQASFHTAPHIALTVEVDVSQLEQTRQRLNQLLATSSEKSNPDKVTLTAILIKIIGWALARHPFVNASLVDEEVYLWQDINIGVATAIENGLIVPVIQNADQLSIGQINLRLRELAERARSGTLALADVQGGTFTISNLGMFGIDQFRAIINPPESAILAVGRVKRKPVAIDERDEVAIRPMMAMTLSADHRVIDGVVAARFLADVVRVIESPDLLLL